MKEVFYFSHDYNASGDPKVSALINEYGAVGYGVFWCIIEQLHQEENHWLPCKQYIYSAIAKQMKSTTEQVESIITHCLLVCELFIEKEGFFTSKRVLSNFEKRASISEKRSIAGKKGAIAKQTQANTSKRKEKKGKEKKGNSTNTTPPAGDEYSQEFLTFWGKYPNRKGKGAAYKAWKKIKRPVETLEKIIAALEWQCKQKDWVKDNGEYIPHPSTYLNGRRWEDEKEDPNNQGELFFEREL